MVPSEQAMPDNCTLPPPFFRQEGGRERRTVCRLAARTQNNLKMRPTLFGKASKLRKPYGSCLKLPGNIVEYFPGFRLNNRN